MKKDKKILLIALGAGALALIAWHFMNKDNKMVQTAAVPNPQNPAPSPPPCSNGLVKCTNSDKCYDPNVNYFADPCL